MTGHCLNQWWLILLNHIDGFVQERHNSIANALELHLSCTNPSIRGSLASISYSAAIIMWSVFSPKSSQLQVSTLICVLPQSLQCCMQYYVDGLVQERRNSSANALELRLYALTHQYYIGPSYNGLPPYLQIMQLSHTMWCPTENVGCIYFKLLLHFSSIKLEK